MEMNVRRNYGREISLLTAPSISYKILQHEIRKAANQPSWWFLALSKIR
jgi:hypothetical protein